MGRVGRFVSLQVAGEKARERGGGSESIVLWLSRPIHSKAPQDQHPKATVCLLTF
jgi:hypothetical protein